MNRKQAGIILTLLALIVCAGILAARVNGQVDDSTISSAIGFTKEDTSSKSKDFFYEARNEREQQDAQTVERLNTIIDDKGTSATQKEDARKQLLAKTMAKEAESNIEIGVKGMGFEDAYCEIENDGKQARVTVKAKELTEVQSAKIQEKVFSVSKINDVIIEVKQ